MCQIVPFTLPCCKRVYVSISKLPSCPNEWPKSKCPPELCIQISNLRPVCRATGKCWRCKVVTSGLADVKIADLRPAIDSAFIVAGLEEFEASGRKTRPEQEGKCKFCGAGGGCHQYCELKQLQPSGETSKKHSLPRKRVRNGLGPEKGKSTNKRHQVEDVRSNNRHIGSVSGYPIPGVAFDNTLQTPYPRTKAPLVRRLPNLLNTRGSSTIRTKLQESQTLPTVHQGPATVPSELEWQALGHQTQRQTKEPFSQQSTYPDTTSKIEVNRRQDLIKPPFALDPALEAAHDTQKQVSLNHEFIDFDDECQIQFDDPTSLDDETLTQLWEQYHAQQQTHRDDLQGLQKGKAEENILTTHICGR